MLQYKLQEEVLRSVSMEKNLSIIKDHEGKKLVIINDIRFKGKKREEWDEIEKYLDFPDEFTHGKDKTVLNGPNLKAKANASLIIKDLVQIATNKSYAVDYNEKHKKKAQYGWYRYDTRLALPIYNDDGELIRYNIFKLRMLVRHDSDGKM